MAIKLASWETSAGEGNREGKMKVLQWKTSTEDYQTGIKTWCMFWSSQGHNALIHKGPTGSAYRIIASMGHELNSSNSAVIVFFFSFFKEISNSPAMLWVIRTA